MPGMNGGRPRRPSTTRRPSSAVNPPGSSQASQDITRPLKVGLEELYTGTTKRLKIGRRLLDGTTEDKILEIQVHPGWKSGTKIRFPHAGNETQFGEAQDLVFVVEEKPHDRFTRDGNDLVTKVKIPLVEALSNEGVKKHVVEALDGRKLQVKVPNGIIKPGQETTVAGEGMPIRKDGSVKNKGDMVVKWEVVFPDRLTPAQKEGIKKVLG